MRVLTILVRFGTEQYSEAEAHLAERFRRQLRSVDHSMIVVDNALPRGTVAARGARTLIGGDNSVFEFSAFDQAIEHVGPAIWSFDLVHFATSAFETLYVSYLDRFADAVLEAIARRPACLGHIDCYNEPVEVFKYRSQHWIRSCFFMMPPTEVKILGRFVSIAAGGRFFSGRFEDPFRSDAPLDRVYRRLVTDWLVGRDIGQGVEWHSRLTLGDTTLPAFERKALCILNEHLLAIRLRALGCRLIDVTWLSTQLARLSAAQISWETAWQQQLAHRDRDAITVRNGFELRDPSQASRP